MQKKTHWPSVIILGIVVAGMLILLLAALATGIGSILSLVSNGKDPAGKMIGSLSTLFEAILLAGAAWFILQKSRGQPKADEDFTLPFSPWHIAVMLGLAALALPLGAVISFVDVKFLSWLILPLLTILLIVPPIWILLGLGTNKIDLGPRWRAFSIFGIGMTLGPLIMIILEVGLLIVLVIIIAVVMAREPGKVNELMQLATRLKTETDPNAILNMLEPYLFDPTVLRLAIAFIALFVPMIEELFKPLGVWLFARQIEKPAQGFALGLLSGAAYALVESLGASGRGDTSWSVVVAVRAGTSLLHIMTTGLMGWAIVAAFQERRWGRLFITYLSAILIHGLWNAAAVGSGLVVVADAMKHTGLSVSILPAAICGMTVLLFGMVGLLITSNRRVRKFSAAQEIPALEADTAKTMIAKPKAEVRAVQTDTAKTMLDEPSAEDPALQADTEKTMIAKPKPDRPAGQTDTDKTMIETPKTD